MARAPKMRSSAGWAIRTSVPDQLALRACIWRAVPTRAVMCTSWPQACMTGFSTPSLSTWRAVEALARPDFSSTGRPSMSARIMTVGPGPLRRTATTPVPPTPVVTS